MDRQQGEPVVGYDVTITRHDFYDGMGTDTEWRVHVKRLSDAAEVEVSFDWRWRARRFGRSRRRIGRAFERVQRHRESEFEHWTLGWKS